jgi:hypothetical protein
MLHAIVDADATADAGREAWAFVPKALFATGDPNDATHAPSPDFQLGALAYRPGGTPAYAHRFYVDATPRASDVDFANTNTSTPPKSGNDWRTVLIGGLGAGARAVYALDVTHPVAPTETESAVASSGRVLWEFTHADLGYVFDAPTLVKTRRYGWVVLIASGHNNPGGDGKLFVINPANGALLTTLSTGVGSDAAPSGFAAIRAYTANRNDPYVEQAYGGDLDGNLWRFDLASADEREWKVERIARLTDASGKPQPITMGVRIEIDPGNGIDRYVLVGTGKLLDQADLDDASAINTMRNRGYARLVSGRNRSEPEDRHRCPRGPWRRGLRVLEAVARPVRRRVGSDAVRPRLRHWEVRAARAWRRVRSRRHTRAQHRGWRRRCQHQRAGASVRRRWQLRCGCARCRDDVARPPCRAFHPRGEHRKPQTSRFVAADQHRIALRVVPATLVAVGKLSYNGRRWFPQEQVPRAIR